MKHFSRVLSYDLHWENKEFCIIALVVVSLNLSFLFIFCFKSHLPGQKSLQNLWVEERQLTEYRVQSR